MVVLSFSILLLSYYCLKACFAYDPQCLPAPKNVRNDRTEKFCELQDQKWRQRHNAVVHSHNLTMYQLIQSSLHLNDTLHQMLCQFEDVSSQVSRDWCSVTIPAQTSHTQSAKNHIELLGLGGLESNGTNEFCLREFHYTENKRNQNYAARVFNDIKYLSESILSNVSSVLSSYGIEWQSVYPVYSVSYQDPGHNFVSCEVRKALGFQSNSSWAFSISYTNDTTEKNLPYLQREFFSEYVGRNQSLNLRWQQCENYNVIEESFGTGLRGFFSGSLGWSHMAGGPIDLNPALQNARDFIDFAKEMVQDIDSPGTTAILLVPAICCIFPIALFQDVSIWTVLVYVFFTDIASVLPVLLRGIELMSYGGRKQYSMVSWVYGPVELREPGATETWVAECSLKSKVSRYGLAFTIFGASAAIVGIFLEVLASWYLNYMKKIWPEEFDQNPNDSAGILWYARKYNKKRTQQKGLKQSS